MISPNEGSRLITSFFDSKKDFFSNRTLRLIILRIVLTDCGIKAVVVSFILNIGVS